MPVSKPTAVCQLGGCIPIWRAGGFPHGAFNAGAPIAPGRFPCAAQTRRITSRHELGVPKYIGIGSIHPRWTISAEASRSGELEVRESIDEPGGAGARRA
jgi:hypothetical protein